MFEQCDLPVPEEIIFKWRLLVEDGRKAGSMVMQIRRPAGSSPISDLLRRLEASKARRHLTTTRQRSCGHLASTIVPEDRIIRSAPSAASATTLRRGRPVTSATTALRPAGTFARAYGANRHWPATSTTTAARLGGRSQPMTMLTQTSPFGEAPPSTALGTYARARQKLWRAPPGGVALQRVFG
jgi:hypothetical protein